MQTTKAYKNNEFLMSEEARSLRILSEYLEPRRRLAMHGINRAIVFFGSARTQPTTEDGEATYYPAAADLAERVANWTMERHHPRSYYHLVTGGGPGIMQAVHEGSGRINSALNIGLNISLPFEQDINSHVNLDNAFEFHYFFMRKFWFLNLAHAAVAFPGGFGTLDELFELLTLIQTGKAQRMPIVLYGHEFWDSIVDFKGLADRGLIAEEDLELFRICDDVDSAFRHLVRGLEPDIALPAD